jgi:hypothetical protein
MAQQFQALLTLQKLCKPRPAVGDELKITISRDGQTMDVTVEVGDRNAMTSYQS